MKEKNELDILIPVFNDNETIVKTIKIFYLPFNVIIEFLYAMIMMKIQL